MEDIIINKPKNTFIVAALFALAIRYLVKNGMCAACENKGACNAKASGGCNGHCASCSNCNDIIDKHNNQ